MDAATLEFMEIVECEPWEVLDIPEYKPITEEDRQRGAGTYQLYFGKHKGKSLHEIPRDYLEWLTTQKPRRRANPKHRKSFSKAIEMAERYLGYEITR